MFDLLGYTDLKLALEGLNLKMRQKSVGSTGNITITLCLCLISVFCKNYFDVSKIILYNRGGN